MRRQLQSPGLKLRWGVRWEWGGDIGPNNGLDVRNEEKVSDDAQVSMWTGSHT